MRELPELGELNRSECPACGGWAYGGQTYCSESCESAAKLMELQRELAKSNEEICDQLNMLIESHTTLQHEHTELAGMLGRCVGQLEQVRTGDDFEAECWKQAEEANQLIARMTERYQQAQEALRARKSIIQAFTVKDKRCEAASGPGEAL